MRSCRRSASRRRTPVPPCGASYATCIISRRWIGVTWSRTTAGGSASSSRIRMRRNWRRPMAEQQVEQPQKRKKKEQKKLEFEAGEGVPAAGAKEKEFERDLEGP